MLRMKAGGAGSIDQHHIDATADAGLQMRQGRQVADVLRQDNREHAPQLACSARVDRADTGMRVRRPHEHGVGDRSIKRNVVDVAAVPGDQALIFAAEHGVADVDAAARYPFGRFVDRHRLRLSR
jgi:hypothetical protein